MRLEIAKGSNKALDREVWDGYCLVYLALFGERFLSYSHLQFAESVVMASVVPVSEVLLGTVGEPT